MLFTWEQSSIGSTACENREKPWAASARQHTERPDAADHDLWLRNYFTQDHYYMCAGAQIQHQTQRIVLRVGRLERVQRHAAKLGSRSCNIGGQRFGLALPSGSNVFPDQGQGAIDFALVFWSRRAPSLARLAFLFMWAGTLNDVAYRTERGVALVPQWQTIKGTSYQRSMWSKSPARFPQP